MRQNGKNPHHTENARTEKSDDHGAESISESPQTAAESFHNRQYHVGCKHDLRPLHGPFDNFWVRVEEGENLIFPFFEFC